MSEKVKTAPARSRASAVAFDFDGTLIRGGRFNNDKAIHILFSTWVACDENGMGCFLRRERLRADVWQMRRAYMGYPGAPRFQQLAAIVNALANHRYDAPASFEGFGLHERFRDCYERVRARYNELYSAMNNVAAEKYWTPYPSVKKTLRSLARDYDLYVASGVTQDILEKDFARHRFDARLFKGVYGGNVKGGDDKGQILARIRDAGYERVIFVADSNKDWEYAQIAAVDFFRIQQDQDFPRLLEAVKRRLPRGRKWSFSRAELSFMGEKALLLLQRYLSGAALSPAQAVRLINQ